MNPKLEIQAKLNDRLKQLGHNEEAQVSYDRSLTHADLVSSVAMSIASRQKKNPLEVAATIVEGLKLPPSISAVQIIRPGFINFTLSNEYLQSLASVPNRKKRLVNRDKVLVEYSSPNIAKPFSVGHLRSTIIGDAVANLYEYLGYDVVRVNHLGDWGTQFGKLIYAYKAWGDDNRLSKKPINEMLALYVKFHSEAEIDPSLDNRGREWFKKLEDGDKEAREIWKKFKQWSLDEFDRIYKILAVKFDKTLGESFYIPKIKETIALIKKHGLVSESEGALIVRFPKDEFPPALLQKNDGASLYMTRDLAALRYRITTMKAQIIIYHIADEQDLYLKQLFKIAGMMGWSKDRVLVHAAHGLMRLPEGKMSTRRGRVIKLDDLINEAIDRAYTIVQHKNPKLPKKTKEAIARVVGVGAIKYNDLMNHRRTAIIFDWDKMLSLNGNSAPYLQYTYARLNSIIAKAKAIPLLGVLKEADTKLLRRISQFDDVVEEAALSQSPNVVARYIFDLANDYSGYYEKYPVLKTDDITKKHRLALISIGAKTIEKGLDLLGIKVLNQI